MEYAAIGPRTTFVSSAEGIRLFRPPIEQTFTLTYLEVMGRVSIGATGNPITFPHSSARAAHQRPVKYWLYGGQIVHTLALRCIAEVIRGFTIGATTFSSKPKDIVLLAGVRPSLQGKAAEF